MSDDHLKGQIVKHYAGSHAYGTSTPESDVDFRGIFLAEKKFVLTPFFNVREVNDVTEEDTKFFELNHFMELCVDANPNILETLWVDDKDIVQRTEMYDHLRSYRDDLLSTKIAYTYTGYAHNQATRMKNHHGWMAKEQIAERRLREIWSQYPCQQVIDWMYDYFPDYVIDRIDTSKGKGMYIKTIIDFDKFMRDTSLQLISTVPLAQHHFVRLVHNYLPEKVLDRDFSLTHYNYDYELIHYGSDIFAVVEKEGSKTLMGLGNLLWDSKKERTPEELKVTPALIVKFNRKEFEENNENRKHYHDWKKNRNAKRSELESKNGYDTKHAMHVVRLLRTAEEALTTGVVNVRRPDAAELLAIRNGAWSYEEMMQYFNDKEVYIREVLVKSSQLRKKPDIKVAAKVMEELYEMYWYNKK
jgi:Predicted nucleotidyltransferase